MIVSLIDTEGIGYEAMLTWLMEVRIKRVGMLNVADGGSKDGHGIMYGTKLAACFASEDPGCEDPQMNRTENVHKRHIIVL